MEEGGIEQFPELEGQSRGVAETALLQVDRVDGARIEVLPVEEAVGGRGAGIWGSGEDYCHELSSPPYPSLPLTPFRPRDPVRYDFNHANDPRKVRAIVQRAEGISHLEKRSNGRSVPSSSF